VWVNCGFYLDPVPDEMAVHSLEHGAVWIAYQPDIPATERDQLRRAIEGHDYVLASPYPGLETRYVLLAWGYRLRLDALDDERVAEFLTAFEQGPQTPEPRAPCSGGAGEPT
jgi:hypothetical protein